MESVVSKEDATVKELTLILREWLVNWKQLYKVVFVIIHLMSDPEGNS